MAHIKEAYKAVADCILFDSCSRLSKGDQFHMEGQQMGTPGGGGTDVRCQRESPAPGDLRPNYYVAGRIGGDLAPSLGGRKFFSDQIFQLPFLKRKNFFYFNADNF